MSDKVTEHCVYGHYVNDELIYIGKGTPFRANYTYKSSRNSTWWELVEGNEIVVKIFAYFDNDYDALEKEGEMIRELTPIANRYTPQIKVERIIKEKIALDYAKASIPKAVIDKVASIYNARIKSGNKCRKADIWLEMAKKVTK